MPDRQSEKQRPADFSSFLNFIRNSNDRAGTPRGERIAGLVIPNGSEESCFLSPTSIQRITAT